MRNLPKSVCKIREIANSCADELRDAWGRLNEIQNPTLQDLEQWLAVKERFDTAQKEFEKKLHQFLTSSLNA